MFLGTAIVGCSRIKSSPRDEWEVQGVMWVGLYSVVVWKSSFFNWREALLIAEIKSNRKALPEVLLSHFLPLPPTLSLSLPLTSLLSSSFSSVVPFGLLYTCPCIFTIFFSLFIHLPVWLRWSKAEQELLQHWTFPRKSAAGDGKGVTWCSSRSSAVVPVGGAEREGLWRESSGEGKVVQCCAV